MALPGTSWVEEAGAPERASPVKTSDGELVLTSDGFSVFCIDSTVLYADETTPSTGYTAESLPSTTHSNESLPTTAHSDESLPSTSWTDE